MLRRPWALLGAAFLLVPAAMADKAVTVGGGLALLNKPASPLASAVLIPGGDGDLGVRPDGGAFRAWGRCESYSDLDGGRARYGQSLPGA
jgi:hypothetical protein